MTATIGKAGRLVVPKELRDRLGLVPVRWRCPPRALRVELVSTDHVVEREGHVLLSGGASMTDDEVPRIRLADQR